MLSQSGGNWSVQGLFDMPYHVQQHQQAGTSASHGNCSDSKSGHGDNAVVFSAITSKVLLKSESQLSVHLYPCLPMYPPIQLSIQLSAYLSTYLSIYLTILSISLSICLSVCLYVRPFVCISVYCLPIFSIYIYLSTTCLSTCLSICPAFCLSVSLSLSICLSLSLRYICMYIYIYISLSL